MMKRSGEANGNERPFERFVGGEEAMCAARSTDDRDLPMRANERRNVGTEVALV